VDLAADAALGVDRRSGDLTMVEPIPGLPPNVLAFTAKGLVTADDYETRIVPAVEAMFSQNAKVRFLYYLGENFAGFEAGALWDDAKLGLRHLTGWEKMALVSDVDWIRGAFKLFALAIPSHARGHGTA
jgi:hypothetical protein